MFKCDANFINQLYFQVNHCARVTFLLKKMRDNYDHHKSIILGSVVRQLKNIYKL